MSRRTRGDATGTSPAPPVPVRARPQLRPVQLFRPHRRPPVDPPGGTVTVSVQVTNTSDREAAEVVQLYLHQRHGSPPDRSASSRLPTRHPGIPGVPAGAVHDRSRAPALLEHHRTGLGPRELHLRRLGRRCSAAELTTTFEVLRPEPAAVATETVAGAAVGAVMVALQVPVAAQSDCRRRCAGRRDYLPSSTSRPTTTPARSPPDLRHAARLVVAQAINRNSGPISTHDKHHRASTGGKLSSCQQKLSAAPPHVALRRTMATCPPRPTEHG